MAWDFDGVDDYVKFSMPAALQTAPGGPMTMAALVHLDAVTDGAFIHTMSGTTSFQFMEIFATYNYGTTAGARTGPAGATGAWYYVILSKQTGNVAPEYTIIPLATMVPTSGTLTGGGVTLGDGTAPGASGFIQVGRWGTSTTEYINGRIAATAIWTAYLNQAAREALTTWALTLASSGLRWAVRYDALSSRVDTIGGGNETARFGTAAITLAADPSGPFFGGDVAIADSSGGGSTSGTPDGLALGDGSAGGSSAGAGDGLALGSGPGGTSSGGSGDGLALGDGSGGSGTGGAGTGLQLGDGGGGGGSAGTGDGLAVGDLPGGGSSGGQADPVATGSTPVAIADSSGGTGAAGAADGLTLGSQSGGTGSGGQADTISGVPVTIGDTSGGGSSGGTPDPVSTQGVVHDNMAMPIAINAHACLLTEVGKLASPPSKVQIRPGAGFTPMADAHDDECCSGIAWVRLGVQTPTSAHWPDQLENVDPPARGVPSAYSVQIELGVIRCVPVQSDQPGAAEGDFPTAAQWLQSAQEFADDAAALRRTICCLQDLYGPDSVLAGVITPLQNEGNCGGQAVLIQVRAPYCDCIEAG